MERGALWWDWGTQTDKLQWTKAPFKHNGGPVWDRRAIASPVMNTTRQKNTILGTRTRHPTDTRIQSRGWATKVICCVLTLSLYSWGSWWSSTQTKDTSSLRIQENCKKKHLRTDLYVPWAAVTDRLVCSGEWCYCYAVRQVPGGQTHSWPTSLVVRNFGIRTFTFCRDREEFQHEIELTVQINTRQKKLNTGLLSFSEFWMDFFSHDPDYFGTFTIIVWMFSRLSICVLVSH